MLWRSEHQIAVEMCLLCTDGYCARLTCSVTQVVQGSHLLCTDGYCARLTCIVTPWYRGLIYCVQTDTMLD